MERRGQIRAMTMAALDTPPPAVQLLVPLDYILSDHFRHRALCHALVQIAQSRSPDRQLVEAVLRFLRTDFCVHVVDEEEDLFPLLRRRAQPEDELEAVLADLSLEHATGRDAVDLVIEALTKAIDSGRKGLLTPGIAAQLRGFAAKERRHLIVENAIVMPLARSRLTPDDLRNLGRRMAARRGIDYPEDANAERPA